MAAERLPGDGEAREALVIAAGVASAPSAVRLILGTMTFARQTGREAAAEMLRLVAANADGELLLDTARLYERGASEALLGELLQADDLRSVRLSVDTKANAWDPGCSLSAASLRQQLQASLSDLRRAAVDVFYLHAPDRKTPIEETLAALQELHSAGKFRELGLSNFSAADVAYIHGYMSERGWVLPTVYQGVYNYLTRSVEGELLPVLRERGIRFYAFNPLCGGLLTGKYAFDKAPSEGRFKERKNYKGWYWKQPYFQALEQVRAACAEAELSLLDAALAWLLHHSSLDPARGDAVILGASTVSQLQANLAACRRGRLPDAVVSSVEAGWSLTEGIARSYFQGQCARKEA